MHSMTPSLYLLLKHNGNAHAIDHSMLLAFSQRHSHVIVPEGEFSKTQTVLRHRRTLRKAGQVRTLSVNKHLHKLLKDKDSVEIRVGLNLAKKYWVWKNSNTPSFGARPDKFHS